MTLEAVSLNELGTRVRDASRALALATAEQKNAALLGAADGLLAAESQILAANQRDVAASIQAGATTTAIDRLTLTPERIAAMADGLRMVANLPDPVGEITEGWTRPSGIRIRKVRVPLGVIGIIYENRPNVTSDAAGLCLKAGNAAFLRGSSAALQTNIVIADAIRGAVASVGLPADAITLVTETTRESAVRFMQLRGVIDLLVPRGGAGLIASIIENATVPFVVDGDGNCHVYVDEAADLAMAQSIVVNAKTSRPGVCNAAESLLVHRSIAAEFLPATATALASVELVGDQRAQALVPSMGAATDEDFATEFLDLKMSVAVVDSIDEAISHVNRYSTGHTEVIVTNDKRAADRFAREVDAAVVGVNVSTRFTDGGEFGYGAEIGNSTQKLHARGPMGLRELTSLKYVVEGDGQIRV